MSETIPVDLRAPKTPGELLTRLTTAKDAHAAAETGLSEAVAEARPVVITWMITQLQTMFPGKEVLPIPSESKAWDKPGFGIGVLGVGGEEVVAQAEQLGVTYHSSGGIIVNQTVLGALEMMNDPNFVLTLVSNEHRDDEPSENSEDLVVEIEQTGDRFMELELDQDQD